MNEKIKEIAEFDGWHKHIELDTPNYLTDLNALHRVALDVRDNIRQIEMDDKPFRLFHAILLAFRSRPINGQYTDLVDAVYDAIVYLKNHNQCQPK